MILNISNDQRNYARTLNGQIRAHKEREKWKDETSAENSYIGFLAEIVICDLFGVKRPEFKPCESDKGHDLIFNNCRIDVKNSPSCAINCEQYVKQKGKCEVYLFTDIKNNGTKLEVLGWLPYGEVKDHKKIRQYKRPPYYKVSNLYALSTVKLT